MLHSLIFSLMIFVMGNFSPERFISTTTSTDPCTYACQLTIFLPNLISAGLLDISNSEMSREKILSNYREYLNERFGPAITENIFFGEKWRKIEMELTNRKYPELVGDYHEIDIGTLHCFSSHPDFLIIYPMYAKHTYMHLYDKFIYLPNTDSLYFNDFWYMDTLKKKINPDDFIHTFNYWVENSNDLKDMEPLCLAGLLLYIRYQYHQVYFVDSPDEIYIAFAIKWAYARPGYMDLGDLPEGCKPALYFEDLEKFANENPQLDTLIQGRIDAQNRHGIYDRYLDHNFHEPIIQSNNGEISITVAILTDHELADWKIVLDSSNHLISMDYLSEPVFESPWDTAYSPYYLDRK